MAAKFIPVQPFNYVIFGATGDLAMRKLIPSLFYRFQDKQYGDSSRIIALARTELTIDEYRIHLKRALESNADLTMPGVKTTVDKFLSIFLYITLDINSDDGWTELTKNLNNSNTNAYYLALHPNLFTKVCQKLAKFKLNKGDARIVLEKPLGRNLSSARSINKEIRSIFQEEQIFRIDHYLGKETVQNLMALRFANALFEPLWNRSHIDCVQITVAEDIGAGSRTEYYDKTGALKDMVQNHILQLLCLVAMEPPGTFTADAIRNEKVKVLNALNPINDTNIKTNVVRAQYLSGNINQQVVPGYLEELKNPESTTETFVAIKALINNWRWSGIPFYLRTGKRMATKLSEVVINFRHIPHSIFDTKLSSIPYNQLVLTLQPKEGVRLFLTVKDPGPGGLRLTEKYLDLSFGKAFDGRQPDAYERLLLDVIRGNQTLFMRDDEVEAAWRWIDGISKAWRNLNAKSISSYMAGSWGPSDAIRMLSHEYHRWQEDKKNH